MKKPIKQTKICDPYVLCQWEHLVIVVNKYGIPWRMDLKEGTSKKVEDYDG